MKSIVFLFLFALLSSSALAEDIVREACTKDNAKDKTLGIVSIIGEDEAETMQYYFTDYGLTPPDEIVFFDDSATKFMALESGKVDVITTVSVEAEYYAKSIPNLKLLYHEDKPFPGMFYMMIHAKYDDLRKQIDSAIKTLKDNGTLAKITETYITKANPKLDFPKVQLPNFPGQPTYTLIMSGVTAPYDMIDSLGNPVGFNIALLAEIAKLTQINFKTLSYEFTSGLSAVYADKAAGMFLVGIDQADVESWFLNSIMLTEPYGNFSDWVCVEKK